MSETKPPSSRKKKDTLEVRVRRIHRRDLNRAWEFLKLVFRDVNRETVEYQRPRSKRRFLEVYSSEWIEQLVYEVNGDIVGYSECAFEATGDDNWVNPRWFEKRGMRPLFVEELAVHPDYQGRGVGSFIMEQLQHLARTRGCTHLVLEVAENNESALSWYRARNFYKLDAAIFLAQKVPGEPDLLPPRRIKPRSASTGGTPTTGLMPEEVSGPSLLSKKPRARRPATGSARKKAASAPVPEDAE
ncbi:ribosomal protein S18 acetylase RimI-like enzyme [Archangium gephyra]|uniref:Acetyltransferase, GNAT family n=1 Tax=Archangium gephyra TaxID=48 RepID=A0AAC8Q1H0_9BACT|nr:GNAT family N-acetyltransferase [Archangium gephyra]AKI99188.1 acetyltransferase, GNAT family [Archangium gephyra]REG31093.1 ribosomal protein S18 acetylase RimI-like enzyme [Archangium gephyra]